MTLSHRKKVLGWRETVALPELGISELQAKIDTGARTTALHATSIETYHREGRQWVRFLSDHDMIADLTPRELPILHYRSITNTSGLPEKRIIVTTTLSLGGSSKRIELSLTDRADMRFPIIIGRTALRQFRLTVDPARSWLLSSNPQKRQQKVTS